jgi:hypothetical protein
MKRTFLIAICILLSSHSFGTTLLYDWIAQTVKTIKKNGVGIGTTPTARSRDLERRSAAWVNVADDCVGVTHDGVTNDGMALNKCILANPNKLLYFPCFSNASGYDYYSAVALTIPSNFVLGCGGAYGVTIGTKLKFATGSSGLILTGTGVTVQNLNVIGSDSAANSLASSGAVNVLIPSAASLPEYQKTISTLSRTGGVTTVRFANVPHWYPANGIIVVSGVREDPTFDGTFYVATTSQRVTGGASAFTYAQAGAVDSPQFSPASAKVDIGTKYIAHGDGITMRQSFQHLENVSVESFGRYGIWVDGGSFIADDWRLDNVNTSKNRAHGFKCSGGDCNAGTALHFSTYLNGLWGIFDTGFLGNTYIAPQASYNFGGAPSKPAAGTTTNITSIARRLSVLSVTTSTAHGFSVGHGVFFAGTSGATYDTAAGTVGCFIATVPSTTSFTCLQPGYALADRGATASGTVRLGSWGEVTTGAAIDGGPFTIGRTNTAGHFLVLRPYDEGGQGPNKYSGGVMVEQPHSGNGTDSNWMAGGEQTVTGARGWILKTSAVTIDQPADNILAFAFKAGSSVDQLEYVHWKNQTGTIKWGLRADPGSGAAQQWGLYNGDPNVQTSPCIRFFVGSSTQETRINAACTMTSKGAVTFNKDRNSGSGGVEVWSGGGAPFKVAGFDGTGVLIWAQQTTVADRFVTAGIPTGTRTITYPDASFTVAGLGLSQRFGGTNTFTQQLISSLVTGTAPFVISSTTPVANLTTVPATYNAAGTQQTAVHLVFGKCTLGTDCDVMFTGPAAYTGPDTYECTAMDQTAAAAVRVNQTSGSAVTFTGTGKSVIRYSCVGN